MKKMKKGLSSGSQSGFLLSLVILGLVVALLSLPYLFSSKAGGQDKTGNSLIQKTESREEGLENYDIRTDKEQTTTLANFRRSFGKDAAAIADVRDKFIAGENALRQKVPTLKVEYNEDIRTPEVIAPDVKQGRAFLTARSAATPSDILLNFVKQYNDLIGVTDSQAAQLEVAADYTNPDGNLSFAHLEQKINGVPVFRGEIKAGFTKQGEMFRVINNLASALEYENLSNDFGNPLDAVRSAAAYADYKLKERDETFNHTDSTDLKIVFGDGTSAVTAEKMYFPTEPGVARTAWRVLIWKPVNAFYVIVDAETGAMLWRKNITADQTQSATYNVYAETTNMLKALRSPASLASGLTVPNSSFQPTLSNRTNVSLIGNESPYAFNNLGWMTDNTNDANGWTDGNAVEAGLDIDGTDGVDLDGKAIGTNRAFNFNYNPPPGNPSPGDSPDGIDYRNGAVTHLVYVNNRLHDEMYRLGFVEEARNFQNDNFGRGGAANDRIRAEAQDSSGVNNANFSTPADGSRGRMQMFITDGRTPERDYDLDTDVIIHEYTHGLSNRLIGNGNGLTTTRSKSLGEGWSDFYALSLLSNSSDPLLGNYPMASWIAADYYYGIRIFPYSVKAFTGGPNNLPYNPQTFADIDPAQISNTDGAYPRKPGSTNDATQVHRAGAIWCLTLWEVRARFISRLGAETGNRKTLQLVTDGMKLSPLDPNFIQGRDAIIAAARASSVMAPQAAADVNDVWEGFRIRGMGFSARENTFPSVTEAFDTPNLIQTPNFSFTDAGGNGYADPGETLVLSIPLTNATDDTAVGTTLQIVGGNSANYGDIASGQTVSRNINYTVPVNQACGSTLTLTFNINSSLGPKSETRILIIGQPSFVLNENFDGVTAPTLPISWTSSPQSGANPRWTTSTTSSVSAPNAVFVPNREAPSLGELESPPINITSTTAKLKFKLNYNTQATYDGLVLEIKIGNGAYQDILNAGGSFNSGGYNGTLRGGGGNPLGGRTAWTGISGVYIDVDINLPIAANGQTVRLKWRMGADFQFNGLGVWMDDVQVINSYTCLTPSAASVTVGGRVTSGEGRGIFRARVYLTDAAGETRTALTGSFGYYRVDDVPAGQTYTLGVMHKRYQFAPKILSVNEEVADFDFIALP